MGSKSYIVRFKDTVNELELNKVIDQVKAAGGEIKHHHTLFKGFTADVPDDHASVLADHPEIAAIEADSTVTTQAPAYLNTKAKIL